MEKPKSCAECEKCVDGWCHGLRFFEPIIFPNKVADWCPLNEKEDEEEEE